MTFRCGVFGATGRMGLSIVREAAGCGGQVVAAVSSTHLGEDIGGLAGVGATGVRVESELAVFAGCDVVIDFSAPAASAELMGWAGGARMPVVSGTTGTVDGVDLQGSAGRLAESAPVVFEPNFSQGVTILFELARLAATWAGPEFDAEVVEMHHRHKVDSPSGTAARLVQVVAEAKEIQHRAHGREGQVGPRRPSEIGVMALRGGDVVGEHTLFLAGLGERIELTHRATDRAIFARGALRAAAWVVGRDPGLYGMRDVLGM